MAQLMQSQKTSLRTGEADAMKKTDAEIQQAVLKELTWDTRVSPTEVGVQVTNRIEVVAPPVASADLRKSIRAALEREAEREVQQIELDVHEGRVSLRGVVHSLRERDAVLDAVRATAGVDAVESSLSVEPYSL
jgi:hypothetical protein